MPQPSYTPKKSLGQHFLHDANIARKIVSLLDAGPDDCVLEIGPGPGMLTALLAATGARVIAIDVDARAIELLAHRRDAEGWGNVRLLHGDILEMDLGGLARSEGRKLRVIGNLPYYITSQILFAIYDAHAWIQDCVVMMQREVADRVTATHGSKQYGILSVVTAMHARLLASFTVSPHVFTPKPQVWSRVLHLGLEAPMITTPSEYILFRRLVRETFGLRRKILMNSMRHAGYDIDRCAKDPIIAAYLSRRPEALAPAEFAALARALAAFSEAAPGDTAASAPSELPHDHGDRSA